MRPRPGHDKRGIATVSEDPSDQPLVVLDMPVKWLQRQLAYVVDRVHYCVNALDSPGAHEYVASLPRLPPGVTWSFGPGPSTLPGAPYSIGFGAPLPPEDAR